MRKMRERSDVLMAVTVVGRRRPWRQGYEPGGAISADRHGGQGRVMIDDIQNLRLILTNLAIDRGDLRGGRGVDAAHQR